MSHEIRPPDPALPPLEAGPRRAHARPRVAPMSRASDPAVPHERKTMRPSPSASLLVAALVMLRRPCARNQATAQLLLTRAADFPDLSPAERDACLSIADELELERAGPRTAAAATPHV